MTFLSSRLILTIQRLLHVDKLRKESNFKKEEESDSITNNNVDSSKFLCQRKIIYVLRYCPAFFSNLVWASTLIAERVQVLDVQGCGEFRASNFVTFISRQQNGYQT